MASLSTYFRQVFPPSPQWSVDEISDLSGKVFIVTGGNSGVGKETCKQLLLKNAKVYLATRSESKAQAALEELEKETGKKALFHKLDLGDLDATKKSAKEFLEKETKLNVLIANAGVMVPPVDQLTAQKFDLQFGTNVLGHFLLIRLLYPLLVSTTTSEDPSRIVWVASAAQYLFKPPIKYEWITDTEVRGKQNPWSLYEQSKFATVQLTYALQMELGDKDEVAFFTLDPGNIKTDLTRHSRSLLFRVFRPLILFPVELGALTQLYAATESSALQYKGGYLRPWARVGEPHEGTKDEAEQKKLWDYCHEALKLWLA
ncbi:NAD(P)-binding protein [Thelephora terrestris]|uniref:NAD(P)-binding protein n=1 Tax=Thelephora terrestris TaxID=56493 RepID=A0A9P6HCW1_9AGAM|nr:NAD(P)-binding protein [Thelephora terrestris]